MHASIVNVDVGGGEGASNSNTESDDRRRHLLRGCNTCRHVCSHYQVVMDDMLWRKLPREVVQHVCAFLPFSKTFELQKLCDPWSRMPMATTFRQSCAKAHEDLFGILMSDDESESYRIAITNSKLTEWFHLELKDIEWSNRERDLFAHDGGLVCILLNSFECFVFNPITGDRRDIPLSSFTSSNLDTDDLESVLLKLKVDSKTGCYELILVTQIGSFGSGAEVYCSERYDSKSKLWSTLDSGFVFGDGFLDSWRGEVYFDCCSKHPVHDDGRPFEEGEAPVSNYGCVTFVKDHRFEIDLVDHVDDDRAYFLLQLKESIWENGWITRSTTKFPSFSIELPDDLNTRILACERYVLVVTDDAPSDVFEQGQQRLLLYDRETCKEVYEIPNFWKEFDGGDKFIFERLHVMCDLKWNAVP